MADGSFMAWLSPDKLDLTLESSEKVNTVACRPAVES